MIVIHGPGRTGKTVHARRFAEHYGCSRIIDIPAFSTVRHLRRAVRDGTIRNDHHAVPVRGEGTDCLILANEPEDYLRANFPPGTTLISIAQARDAIGLEPVPEGGFPLPLPTSRPVGGKPLSLGCTERKGAYYYSLAPALEDAETWFGPHPSRDAACLAARSKTDEPFWTAAAKPIEHDLTLFVPAMSEEDGVIAKAFDALNEHHYGDDNESGPTWWDEAHVRDLIARLNATFATWAKTHGYQRAWALDVTDERREERGARG
ncbi:MAG: hypothetical protein ACK4TC_05030 [Sphingomonas pseudosanguinis]|uniref:hypothetical protein n=1 Tax=Sphingomonas pseudosanguinis TaxID=413712 RepID=UPI00391A4A7E